MMQALGFSGGKDSWACLWLHEHELADTLVMWVDTGKNAPEILDSVAKARAMCPNFLVINSDREGQNRTWGLPSDIVPVNWTKLGQTVTQKRPVLIQSYLDCCYANINWPLYQAVKQYNIKDLILGQRNDDGHRGLRQNGQEVEGVTVWHPLENWTKAQVLSYLQTKMPIPDHFHLEHTSIDCYDCTAYKKESKDKVIFLRDHHPKLYAEYAERQLQLNMAIATAVEEDQA